MLLASDSKTVYEDVKSVKTGETMSGALNMGYKKIMSQDNPTENQDAASKNSTDTYCSTIVA